MTILWLFSVEYHFFVSAQSFSHCGYAKCASYAKYIVSGWSLLFFCVLGFGERSPTGAYYISTRSSHFAILTIESNRQ